MSENKLKGTRRTIQADKVKADSKKWAGKNESKNDKVEIMIKICSFLPKSEHLKFKSKCVLDGVSMQDKIIKLVKEWSNK